MKTYIFMFMVSEFFAFLFIFWGNKTSRVKVFHQNNNISFKSLGASIIFVLTSIPFLIVSGLRYQVGTDYLVYTRLQIPLLMNGVDYKLKYEYLYQFLIKVGMSLGDVQWVFILTHCVYLFFIFYALKNYSVDLRWSIYIFMFGTFFNNSLNIMRQSIAIAVFLYATKYILEKNLKKYILFIVVAFMFHKTAIIFLPLYFLPRLKLKEEIGLLIIATSYLFRDLIRDMLIKITSKLGLYSIYFNSQFDVNDTQWGFTIFNVLLYCLIIFVNRNWKKNYPVVELERYTKLEAKNYIIFDQFYTNLQFLTATISILSAIIPNSTRIIIMFSIGQILYIPFVIKKIKDRQLKIIISFLVVLLYLFLFYRLIIQRNIGETLPYQFIGGFGWN